MSLVAETAIYKLPLLLFVQPLYTGGTGSPPVGQPFLRIRLVAVPGFPTVLRTSPTAPSPAGTKPPLLLSSALSSVGLPLGMPGAAAHVVPGFAASPALAVWSAQPSLPFLSTAPGTAVLGGWSTLQKPCRSPVAGSDADPKTPSVVRTSASTSHAAG